MKYIIILAISALLIGRAAVKANVCIEQPPGEVICVPESPVNPAQVHRVFLPVVTR